MQAVIPLRGPDFSTFSAQDVTWLVHDVSDLALERPIEVREKQKSLGERHYAMDLPVETSASEEYRRVFLDALPALARQAGSLTFRVAQKLAQHKGPELVLISLIRAGVPPGTWIRRILVDSFERQVPHYAMSIVKGFGLDKIALQYVLARHRADDIFFVDGWTGSGAIRRELRNSLRKLDQGHIADRLVVLSDPAGVAELCGTRRDVLLPSACLNATSCGLVSRTVILPTSGRNPGHGAKFYRELSQEDMTSTIRDRVLAQAVAIAPHDVRSPESLGSPRGHSVRSVWDQWGLVAGDIKFGMGESMRVMQRRLPHLLILDPSTVNSAAARVLTALAAERGAPIVVMRIAPYGAAAIAKSGLPAKARQ